MCWNCGCMISDDDHGSADNVTTETLRKAARAGGTETIHKLMENMNETYRGQIADTPLDQEPV